MNGSLLSRLLPMLFIALLLSSCGADKPSAPESAEPSAAADSSLEDSPQSSGPQNAIVVEPPKRQLNLSRKALGDSFGLDGEESDIKEAQAVLPDLFSEGKESKRLSTRGRLLTDEEAGVTLDAIDGVELSIELKTN